MTSIYQHTSVWPRHSQSDQHNTRVTQRCAKFHNISRWNCCVRRHSRSGRPARYHQSAIHFTHTLHARGTGGGILRCWWTAKLQCSFTSFVTTFTKLSDTRITNQDQVQYRQDKKNRPFTYLLIYFTLSVRDCRRRQSELARSNTLRQFQTRLQSSLSA